VTSSDEPVQPAALLVPTPPTVEPIDNDGVGVTTAGTIVWFVGLIITGLSYHWLTKHHDTAWIGVCAIGFAFGLIGTWYTVRRRAAYRAAAALGDPRVTKAKQGDSASQSD